MIRLTTVLRNLCLLLCFLPICQLASAQSQHDDIIDVSAPSSAQQMPFSGGVTSQSPAHTPAGERASPDKWLVVGIVLEGARSFAEWLTLPNHPTSAHDRQNRGRLRNFDGLLAPQMMPQWQSLAEHPGKHYLKNIGSEWVRLDPQRAYKTLSFFFVAGSLLVMIVSLIAGIGIGTHWRRRRGKSSSV